jgi:hypothetical protein
MTKPQILKAIRLSAKKLGRNPNLRDLRLLGGVSEPILYKRFGGLGRALAAAGYRRAPIPCSGPIHPKLLLLHPTGSNK